MKKLICITVIMILMICMLTIDVYAYENDIFKIDLPSDYGQVNYGNIYMFVKSEETVIVIYTVNSVGLKKNISTMSKSDVEEIIGSVVDDDITIIEQDKEKLGKSKAIKARVRDEENNYMDMYIVVSDKHVLLVCFMAESEAGLDSAEYLKIKKSFKMKERTTNSTVIRVLIFGAVAVGVVLKIRKKYFIA